MASSSCVQEMRGPKPKMVFLAGFKKQYNPHEISWRVELGSQDQEGKNVKYWIEKRTGSDELSGTQAIQALQVRYKSCRSLSFLLLLELAFLAQDGLSPAQT